MEQENQQHILLKMNDIYGEEYKNKLQDVLSKINYIDKNKYNINRRNGMI